MRHHQFPHTSSLQLSVVPDARCYQDNNYQDEQEVQDCGYYDVGAYTLAKAGRAKELPVLDNSTV